MFKKCSELSVLFLMSLSLDVSQKIGRARKRKRNYCATIMSFPWSVLQLLTIALGQIAQLLENMFTYHSVPTSSPAEDYM